MVWRGFAGNRPSPPILPIVQIMSGHTGAHDRHGNVANYLYLDGHAATLAWDEAVPAMYPDRVVLTQDGSYPQ